MPVLLLLIVSAKLDRLKDAHPDEKGLLGVLIVCCLVAEVFGVGSGILGFCFFFFFVLKNIDRAPRDLRSTAIGRESTRRRDYKAQPGLRKGRVAREDVEQDNINTSW